MTFCQGLIKYWKRERKPTHTLYRLSSLKIDSLVVKSSFKLTTADIESHFCSTDNEESITKM